MTDIKSQLVAMLGNGRRIFAATEFGTYPFETKEGTVAVPYSAGDLMLAEIDGTVIAGPIGPDGARALAADILEGKQGAITNPKTVLVMALGIHGFVAPDRAPIADDMGARP